MRAWKVRDLDKPNAAVSLFEHEILVWVRQRIVFLLIFDFKRLGFLFHEPKVVIKADQDTRLWSGTGQGVTGKTLRAVCCGSKWPRGTQGSSQA